MKNLFVFLFLCNFLLLCHAHGGGNYEHSDMLASMKPGDKAALLDIMTKKAAYATGTRN